MDNYLKLLQLASAFTDKKDVRLYTRIVNVRVKDSTTVIEATQGHVAIRISIKQDNLNSSHVDHKQYSIESIAKSNKVNVDLLETVEEVRFPNFDKIFKNSYSEGSNYATFDLHLVHKAINPLKTLCKSLKIKFPRINIVNLASESATILNMNIIENVLIEVAIMPMKP